MILAHTMLMTNSRAYEAGLSDPAGKAQNFKAGAERNNMQINYRVSRDFIHYSDSGLDEFANIVAQCLTGNAAFPNPPVPPAPITKDPANADAVSDLTTLDLAFRNAIAAATGDPQATAAKEKARESLLDALRKDANYVESIASHDLETLLSSGYYASSTNHAQSPLDPPGIVTLTNLAATQLLLRVTPITNAKSYQVQTNTNGNGTWTEAGIYTQARRIVLTSLTPGTVYSVRARAIGGSTGYSDWSKAASQMAT